MARQVLNTYTYVLEHGYRAVVYISGGGGGAPLRNRSVRGFEYARSASHLFGMYLPGRIQDHFHSAITSDNANGMV